MAATSSSALCCSGQHLSGQYLSRTSFALQDEIPETVFDLLFNEYLPFRLYAEYMLGAPPAELARRYALSEIWITERIDAIGLCVTKQVRLNLLATTRKSL